MTTKTEGLRAGDLIVFELDKHYSRRSATIASGEGELPAGAVLGEVTASGKLVHSPNASVVGKEGAETATAVLTNAVDATGADVAGVVVDDIAIVNRSNLSFHASVDDATKRQAKIDQLAAARIKARTGA